MTLDFSERRGCRQGQLNKKNPFYIHNPFLPLHVLNIFILYLFKMAYHIYLVGL